MGKGCSMAIVQSIRQRNIHGRISGCIFCRHCNGESALALGDGLRRYSGFNGG